MTPKPPKDRVWPWFWCSAVVVAALRGAALWLAIASGEEPGTAAFGDAFGAVNALFSGLAFAAVFMSLRGRFEAPPVKLSSRSAALSSSRIRSTIKGSRHGPDLFLTTGSEIHNPKLLRAEA